MLARFVRSTSTGLFVLSALLLAMHQPERACASPCTGDCNTNGQTTINELLTCVNIALDNEPRTACVSCDANNDGAVTIDELLRGVTRALTDCKPDFVNAATGVTQSNVQVADALRIIDFGYVGNFSAAPALSRGSGGGAADSCVQCPGGGRADGYACTVTGTTSTLSATLVACAANGVTRSGQVELRIGDPTFCNTCQIPLNVRGTQTLSNYSEVSTAQTVEVSQTLTEAFTLTAEGCRGLGLQDRMSTYNGTLRIQAAGSDVAFTYEDLTATISSTGPTELCAVTSTQAGTVHVNDVANNRRFVQSGDLVVTTTTAAGGDRTVTINTPSAATYSVDCLGGAVTLQTQQALQIPANAACPTAGLLQVELLGGTTSLVQFTASGGLAFDFTADGTVDQTVASCLDPSLSQCRVDLPPSTPRQATPTETATPGPATLTPTGTQRPSTTSTRTVTPTRTATPTQPTSTPTPTGCPENASLSPGVAYSCAIRPAGDVDVFKFTLTDRTRVIVQATEIPPNGAGGWNPCLTLLPDLLGGMPIVSQCDTYHPRLDIILDPGTYYALVQADNNVQTGDYEILYQPLRAVDAAELTPDVPLPSQIENPGDIDLYSFTLLQRTRVILQATEIPPNGAGGWNPCLALLPDLVGGMPIASQCDTYHPRLDVVLDPGTYYAVVNEQSNYILGDYEILYQPLRVGDALELAPDTPMPGAIDWRGDVDLYSFTLLQRTRVILQATEIPPNGTGGWNPCLALLPDLLGGMPIASQCDTYHPRLDVVLDPGTYYAVVNEQSNYILGDYEILYQQIGA